MQFKLKIIIYCISVISRHLLILYFEDSVILLFELLQSL